MRSAAVIALIGAALSGQPAAQTMYRCGKQYQDRPCDAGQQGRAVGSATTGAGGGTSDAECRQRGERALQVIWAREGGTTADAALSQAGSADQRALVQQVYARRGSSSQIRAAIEADCVAQKEREAQAAAMVKAMGLSGSPQQPAQPAAQPTGEDAAAVEARRQRLAAENEAAARKATCSQLNAEMQRNVSAQRTGGSVATMERLNDQRRDIERRVREAGC